MLCSGNFCGCGIVSASLAVTGSGALGDPYKIESDAFAVVTSSTRPASPFVGQSILETDTKRYLYWDGTFWIIQAGQFPGCSAYITGGTQVLTSGANADIALATESYDIGPFHTGTNAFLTVPAGMAGDYRASGRFRCSANGNLAQRTVSLFVASNGAQVNPILAATTFPNVNSNNTGVSISGSLRLIAGATVTLGGYQDSLANATVAEASLSLDMTRHIPSLV